MKKMFISIFLVGALLGQKLETIPAKLFEETLKSTQTGFFLFFDKQDGSTEDIHIEFAKAKQTLFEYGISIGVFEVTGKLTESQENEFSIFKLPKIKFWHLGKLETFTGVQKKGGIIGFIRKRLNSVKLESTVITSLFHLNLIVSKTEKFAIFYGKRNSKSFELFEELAKSKMVSFFNTENVTYSRYLGHVLKGKNLAEVEQKPNESEDDWAARIGISLEDCENCENHMIAIRKFTFFGESKFLGAKVPCDNLEVIKSSLGSLVSLKLVPSDELLKLIPTKVPENKLRIILIFYVDGELDQAFQQTIYLFKELPRQRYTISLISQKQLGNLPEWTRVALAAPGAMVYDPSMKTRWKRFYKFFGASDNRYKDGTLETIKSFEANDLEEYVKSQPPGTDYKDEGINDIVGYTYPILGEKTKDDVFIIFYGTRDTRLKKVQKAVRLAKKSYKKFAIRQIHLGLNDVDDVPEPQKLPYVRVMSKGKVLGGMAYLENDKDYENFFITVMKPDDEL